MKHVGSVSEDFIELGYIAECSCGWAHQQRDTEAEAYADLVEHRKSTTETCPKCDGLIDVSSGAVGHECQHFVEAACDIDDLPF